MKDKRAAQSGVASPASRAEAQPCSFNGQEIEIKFRLEKDAAENVLKFHLFKDATISPGRELVSIYYDTAEGDLQRHAIALRIRKKGRGAAVMGVKWGVDVSAGVFARGEAEVACPAGTPDMQLLDPATQARLTDAAAGRALAPLFETRVKRRVARLRHHHSDIEIALDEGHIIAGEARLPLKEIELELKSGNLQDLLDCASALALEPGLHLDFESKSARGYRLMLAQAPMWQKAPNLELPAEVSFDDLLAGVICHTLSHFVANWAALRQTDESEAVHQLRVALRRMRSALGIFRRAIKLPELDDIREEAKRIATALGPARECDVFRQNALQGPFLGRPDQFDGAEQLLQAVELRRQDAYAKARLLLEERATALFVLKMQSFVTRRAWRTALAPEDLGLLTSPGKLFASEVLDRLMRRAIKRGKRLAELPDEERHELRIELKKLRYATEFFGSLFAGRKEVRSFLRTVSDLQEYLGAHNDAATAEAFLKSLPFASGHEPHFAAGYLLGWYRHAMVTADAQLLEKWKDFKRASAFWE